MNVSRGRRCVSTLALLLALGGVSLQAADAPSGSLLHPAEAVVYLNCDGAMAHYADYQKTAAYDAIDQSGLKDAMEKAFGRVKQMAGREATPEQMKAAEQVLEGLAEIADRGLSLSVVVTPPQGGPPSISGTLVLNGCAGRRAVLEDLIRKGLADENDIKIEPYLDGTKTTGLVLIFADGGNRVASVSLFEKSGHLVLNAASYAGELSPARGVSLAAVNGKGANVSTHRLYKSTDVSEGFVQNALGWFDIKSLRDMFGDTPLPPLPSGAQLSLKEMLALVGVEGVDAVVTRSGYKGRATWNETWLIAPGPRKGLLSLIDQKPFTLSDLPPLPAKVINLSATSVDMGQVYDALVGTFKTVAGKVSPDVIPQFDEQLLNIESQIGFSIKKDLLAPLNGVLAISADGGGSQSLDSIQVAMGVKDPDRLRRTLTTVFAMISDLARGEVTFETNKKYGRDVTVMRIRQAPIVVPTLCIDKQFLFFGLLPQSVDMALLRTDGKVPRWNPAVDQADAFKELPKSFTALTYNDTAATYRQILGSAPMLLGLAQAGIAQSAPGFEFPLRAEDLPPGELVAAPLFPNIAVNIIDQNGVKSIMRSSMPGSEALVGVAGGAIVVAILLPAVQQAREAARRAQERRNLN